MLEARERMSRGDTTCVELVRELHEKNTQGAQMRAVVELAPIASLLEKARIIDSARGQDDRPLLGVPVTIKEHIAVSGMKLTLGVDPLVTSQRDSTIVRRLRDAGALILGTTNISDWGLSYDTTSTLYGRTPNPHNARLSSGGSSGGESCAVATGMSLGGIGGDVGGGIRIAAAFCGVLGLRPTPGRVPQTGIGYSFLDKGLTGALSCYGPIGTNVEDLELLLKIISGTDFHDPHCIAGAYQGDSRSVDVGGLRVGFSFGDSVEAPARDAVLAAVGELRRVASSVVPVDTQLLRSLGLPLAARVFGIDAGDAVAALSEKHGVNSQHVQWHMDFVKESRCEGPMDVVKLINDLNRFTSRFISMFRDIDVWICPVTDKGIAIAPEECHDFANIVHTLIVSLGKVPSGVVGNMRIHEQLLPVGVQIVAAPMREDIVLSVMKLLTDSLE